MDGHTPGLLIAVEGIDGSGKTTQVQLLTEFFQAAGQTVVRSKEPTDGPWGRMIRQSASTGRMSLDRELAAFIADRKEHVKDKIAPALARGETVILDRYFYSTIAYQGARGKDTEQLLAMMLEIAPKPDAVILLDVPAAIGLGRIEEGRGETPNAFEDKKNLQAARQIFLQLATTQPNIIRIDGTPSVPFVQWTILDSLLNGVLKTLHCAKHWGCADPYNCAYRITGTCQWAQMVAASRPFRPASIAYGGM